MRLYKATYRDRQGQVRQAAALTAEFRDHLQIARRLTLFTDRGASERAADRLGRLLDLRIAGAPPDRELTAWLAGLEPRILGRLADWGIVQGASIQAGKPLTEHLAEYRAALLAKGDTAGHVTQTETRLTRLLGKAKATVFTDLTPERLRNALEGLRVEDSLSGQTANYYLAALKAFCRWLEAEGRAQSNPTACLKPISRKALQQGARRIRRALTVEECRRLLETTSNAPYRYGMTGRERAILYRLALETGLRASELRSLATGACTLTGRLAVHVEASATKNGRPADLPLRPETAEELKDYLRNRLPTALAFRLPPCWDMAEMVRADMKDAGIDTTHLDFHSLRHSFITLLAASGIHPKVAQDLARHSDINLTLSRYTHTVLEQRAEAVCRLPDLGAGSLAEVREGTTGLPLRFGENAALDAKQNAKTAQATCIRSLGVSGCGKLPTDYDSAALPLSYAGTSPAEGNIFLPPPYGKPAIAPPPGRRTPCGTTPPLPTFAGSWDAAGNERGKGFNESERDSVAGIPGA